ncbi:DUF5107 domain-containing protein [Vibrio harveyi]|nr:DUF5107 domain-containing protein [Vibrio harveyi]
MANHHVSPGKKQWTWGNCDFGLAWDRQLTDSNGPYIELMTGVYTDNQPDFTWIDSHEEKKFTQHFLPYSNLDNVHNANTEVAIKLDRSGSFVEWAVYAISEIANYEVVISDKASVLAKHQLTMTPGDVVEESIELAESTRLTHHNLE